MKGLTKEQTKKLEDISKLSLDDQKEAFSKFLKELSPEQVEYLKSQQGAGSQCIFCSIIEGNIDSVKIYEDKDLVAVLDINPANLGHTLVIPKKHYRVLAEVPDKEISELFDVVNKLSKDIFEITKAEGTNIFIANGAVAGQNVDHTVVHIIPRFKNDKINFFWDPKKVSKKDLENLGNKLKQKIKIVKTEKKKIKKVSKEENLKLFKDFMNRMP